MTIETSNEELDLIGKKIQALNSFCQTLGLDPDKEGNKLAVLIEELVNQFPENWLDKLDDIMIETHTLMSKSAKEAMTVLGKRIMDIEKKLMEKRYADRPERLERVNAVSNTTHIVLQRFFSDDNIMICTSVSTDNVPEWWTDYEISEGKYDDVVKKYLGMASRRFSEIISSQNEG